MERRRRHSSHIFPILALGLTVITAWLVVDSDTDTWQAFSAHPRTVPQDSEHFPDLSAPAAPAPAARDPLLAGNPPPRAAEPLRDSLTESAAPARAAAAPRSPVAKVEQAFGAAQPKAVPAPRQSYALTSELTPIDPEAAAATSASYTLLTPAPGSEGDSGSGGGSSGEAAPGREPSEYHPQDVTLIDSSPMAADAALPELASAAEEGGGDEASGGDEGGGDEGGAEEDDGGDDGGGRGDDGGGGVDAFDLESGEDAEPLDFQPAGYEYPDPVEGDPALDEGAPRQHRKLPPECRKRSHRRGLIASFRDFMKCLRALRKQEREERAAAAIARMDPMCRRGNISPDRCGRSLAWYREQAAHGDVSSHFMIGTVYAQGREVPQDRVEAYAWYLRADQLGHTPSHEVLGMMEPRMTPEMIAEARRRAEQLGGRPNTTAKVSQPSEPPKSDPETPKTPAKPSRPRLTTTLTPI